MDIEHLAAELTEGLEPPVSLVCTELITRFSEIPASEQRRMSFKWLASLVHLEWDNGDFQGAIAALTTVRDHPLTLYFVMWDEVEHREISVELADFKEALRERCFVHPTTGEEIESFEDRLVPVFRLSHTFADRLNAVRG